MCKKKLVTLWAHMKDLEKLSQRNNVRMVGLKEGKEERRYMAQEVE